MDNLKKIKITLPELPPEILLFQILPKLPAKSILRFKSVCKQWRSFLTTPTFTKIHLHHVTTIDRHRYRHEKLLFFNSRSPASFNVQTIDCEDGLISTPRCHPFTGIIAMPITSSVNGLVCVGIWKNKHEFSDMILWNPLTGEYKPLSRPVDRICYNTTKEALELYYTCSDDDYKILSVNTHRSVYIYSLKSDSWRKLESTLYDDHARIPYARDHNLLDEKLHFLRRVQTGGYIITRLDLKTEKFTKIVVPSSCSLGCLRFMVVKGCIQLTIFKADLFGNWTIEECQMDGDGNWTKVVNSIYLTRDLRPSYLLTTARNVLFSTPWSCFLRPLYLTRNGSWLLHHTYGISKIDPEKNTKDDLYLRTNIAIYPRGMSIYSLITCTTNGFLQFILISY